MIIFLLSINSRLPIIVIKIFPWLKKYIYNNNNVKIRVVTTETLHCVIEQGQLSLYSDWLWAGVKIFRTRPDRPSGPPSLLYSGHRVFLGVKTAEALRWPPTPHSAEVKERIGLDLHSISGPSCSVLGWTLPLRLPVCWLNAFKNCF